MTINCHFFKLYYYHTTNHKIRKNNSIGNFIHIKNKAKMYHYFYITKNVLTINTQSN